MSREECIELMRSSDNRDEWNHNCDIVKSAFGGDYPVWWYDSIVLSGLANVTITKWMTAENGEKDMAL